MIPTGLEVLRLPLLIFASEDDTLYVISESTFPSLDIA